MWGQTLRDWASTSLSELAPLDGHGRSFGAYLHLGLLTSPHPPLRGGVTDSRGEDT